MALYPHPQSLLFQLSDDAVLLDVLDELLLFVVYGEAYEYVEFAVAAAAVVLDSVYFVVPFVAVVAVADVVGGIVVDDYYHQFVVAAVDAVDGGDFVNDFGANDDDGYGADDDS
jgi:hypothetical protein